MPPNCPPYGDGPTDRLEARTSELEANQFSTTSILQGEVAFVLADAWGGDGISSNSNDAQTIFASRGRLNLVTSFTGRDRLHTRLQFGNLGNGFADQINTNEGRFAFDGDTDNSLDLNRLHYVFPATDNLQVTIMANAGGHQFYSDTFNPGLEAGGGRWWGLIPLWRTQPHLSQWPRGALASACGNVSATTWNCLWAMSPGGATIPARGRAYSMATIPPWGSWWWNRAIASNLA